MANPDEIIQVRNLPDKVSASQKEPNPTTNKNVTTSNQKNFQKLNDIIKPIKTTREISQQEKKLFSNKSVSYQEVSQTKEESVPALFPGEVNSLVFTLMF